MSTSDFLSHFRETLAGAIAGRLSDWQHTELAGSLMLERPATREHGDLATNLAMIAAGAVKRPPRELAQELIGNIEADTRMMELCRSVEIAGPGFINFFLRDPALIAAAREALQAGLDFGRREPDQEEEVLLEFVSANPTGQLHVGHARYAAYGDSLRRIMSFTGTDVTTEFYVNDFGSQMVLFGRSLALRYAEALGLDVTFPEDGYQGDYPVHIAGLIKDEVGDSYSKDAAPEASQEAVAFFRKRGCEIVLDEMRAELDRFGVRFDNWFSEQSLYDSGAVPATIEELQGAGEIYEHEGALWLHTAKYGDDKDRVVIRGSGEPTYFASDIAYHRNKLERGFGRLINIWGADHHGYVPRMKAAFEALAHDPERLEIIIGQLVNVIEMGEKKQMSKRAGTMVTLAELLDSIGVDAARFFLVDRSHDTTLDLDLEKAKLQSEENPVYYVQYAHARISSILRKAEEEGYSGAEAVPAVNVYDSVTAEERELVMKILEYPGMLLAAAANRSPQRLTTYGRELAATFHVFYHNCPVLKAAPEVSAFRLELCLLTRHVVASCLDLVGVSAPERM